MDKRCEHLAYASWKTRLRGAVHHLAIAATLWESCKEIACLCEDGDPRKEHLESMGGDDPLFATNMWHKLFFLSDELQEAELRGEEAMQAREKGDAERD
jgi:hypothetical protein